MISERDAVIRKLVRRELDAYVAGWSLRDRMAGYLDIIEEWTNAVIDARIAEGKPALTAEISSLGGLSREEIILEMMERDTDNIVSGYAIKARMVDLHWIVHSWVHDARVKAQQNETSSPSM